jgi:hypothetical protein
VNTSKAVEALLPDLESGDAFARLDAGNRLQECTRRDFGFRWDGTDGERARAVARVRAWLEERRRDEGKGARSRRRAAAEAAALEFAKAKGLDPAQVQKHIEELLAKAPALAGIALGRPACQACTARPATVEIVEIAAGRAKTVRRLCEPCASKGG